MNGRAATRTRPLGTVHFPDSADRGEAGDFLDSADRGAPGLSPSRPTGVTGRRRARHRVADGQPLRDVPKLRPGDDVVVETCEAV